MRNLIVSAAAALLACALPGVAAAQSGYAGASLSQVEVDGFDETEAYGVEGAVAFDASDGISFELDAAIVDSDDSETALGVTGHLFTRNDNYLFGGFVGAVNADDSTVWTAGVEANKYFENVTLAGAVAYASNDDADVDGWGATGQVRYFVHDNFRVQGGVTWANVDFGGAEDDALGYNVGAEYQFAEIPISLVGSYSRTEFDEADFETDAFSIGIRYNWGGSLKDRDRNGASQADLVGVSSAFAS